MYVPELGKLVSVSLSKQRLARSDDISSSVGT